MVLRKTYKGNTLPEVLIAIVIISFTSAMGITIYLNIQQNTQPFHSIKANELALKYLNETQKKQDYFDATYKEDEFTIHKTMQRSDNFPDCIVLKINVSKATEKKSVQLQQLIHVKQ
jgi:prepilin-type N-terminal cleavage/methylation domain-containing protein